MSWFSPDMENNFTYPMPNTQMEFFNVNQTNEEPEEEQDEYIESLENENCKNIISLLSKLELTTSNRFELISFLSNNDNF